MQVNHFIRQPLSFLEGVKRIDSGGDLVTPSWKELVTLFSWWR